MSKNNFDQLNTPESDLLLLGKNSDLEIQAILENHYFRVKAEQDFYDEQH